MLNPPPRITQSNNANQAKSPAVKKNNLDKNRLFIDRMAIKSQAHDKHIDINLRRAYILPTLKGLYYFITVIIMFIWSVNYALSLGYALTFFTGIFALIVAVLTVGNLAGIRFKPLENPTFFAGEPAYFRLEISNISAQPKIQLRARRNGLFAEPISLLSFSSVECQVPIDDVTRGRKILDYVRFSADYPLGIFSSWTWLRFDASTLIYPQPKGDLPLPFLPSHHSFDEGKADLHGSEDFHDLRDYQAGDNLRHVLWKKMTNGQVRVKTFRDLAGQQCILDFDDENLARLGTEARLSQLCAWVLQAEKSGTRYTLQLPSQRIEAGIGIQHQARCLEALACF